MRKILMNRLFGRKTVIIMLAVLAALLVIAYIMKENYLFFSSIVIVILIIFIYFSSVEAGKARMAEKDKLLKEKEAEIQSLIQQKNEIASTAFNVQDVKQILEISFFEAKTRIYRTMDRRTAIKNGERRFFGAMRLDITAKYGVNMKEIICSVGENKTLYLDNVEPRFLAFSSRSSEWEIAECLERKKRLFNIGGEGWRVSREGQAEFARIKDEFRLGIEREIEQQGPMELGFLNEMIKEKVISALRIIIGHFGFTLKLGTPEKGSHVPFEAFLESPQKYLMEREP